MTDRNDAPQYPTDAIALLKTDHRKVKNLFARYESAGHFSTKHLLAAQVFTELDLHTQLEENVFYPAYEAMTGKNGTQLVADSRLAHEHVRELMIELRALILTKQRLRGNFTNSWASSESMWPKKKTRCFPRLSRFWQTNWRT